MNEEMDINRKNALKERFKAMGVGNAGTIMQTSKVETGSKNSSAYQKLNMIKSGAARDRMQELLGAKAAGNTNLAGGSLPPEFKQVDAGGFQALKVPKPKRRPGQKEESVKPEYKQKLAEFDAPKASGDLGAVAAMFRTKSPSQSMNDYSTTSLPGNSRIQIEKVPSKILDLDFSNMPVFNADVARQKMAAKKAAGETNYMKYSLNGKIAEEEDGVYQENYHEQDQTVGGGQITLESMREMMEAIAEGTIKKVLDNYDTQRRAPVKTANTVNKNEMLLEFAFNEKGTKNIIMKDETGQHYRVTPVNVAKR